MKFSAVLILAVLALSVAAQDAINTQDVQANQTGSTADDFHENTDIQRTSNQGSQVWTDSQKKRDLESGEVLLGDVVEGQDATQPITFSEWVNQKNADGTISRVKVTRTILVTKSTVVRSVRKFWNSSVSLDSVKPIVLAFTDQFGQELNQTQLDMFNFLASTDDQGAYQSNYNYVQVRLSNLKSTLKAITDIFYSPLDQTDLDSIEATIRTCTKDRPVALNINTDAGEKYNADGWTVRIEALFSTCAEGKPGVQLASYAASKSGGWATPERFSTPNSKTVDDIITQWLFRTLNRLFSCDDADVRVKATAISNQDSADQTSAVSRRRV